MGRRNTSSGARFIRGMIVSNVVQVKASGEGAIIVCVTTVIFVIGITIVVFVIVGIRLMVTIAVCTTRNGFITPRLSVVGGHM
jgi:hypothetical protein